MTDGEPDFDILVTFRRVDDGQTAVYRDTYGQNWRYQYGEGNYACDCNRHAFFERASGRGGDDDLDSGCSHDRYDVVKIERADTGAILIEGDPRS